MSDDVSIRQLAPADHAKIIAVMPSWWDGRDLTSLVAENPEKMVGFLIGFMSPSFRDEAYIHFVGVDPGHRGVGLARKLYERFFLLAQEHGRRKVRCCTSPVNRGSIAFHKRLGFSIEPGTGMVDGFPVDLDHNKPGDHKVQFVKLLPAGA